MFVGHLDQRSMWNIVITLHLLLAVYVCKLFPFKGFLRMLGWMEQISSQIIKLIYECMTIQGSYWVCQFNGRKCPFTGSANMLPVNSICYHQISNWCREIFKYNTVSYLLIEEFVWKEQRFYCCSTFHSHSSILNKEHTSSNLKMSVKWPLTCLWVILLFINATPGHLCHFNVIWDI
jgi:hypothetical protein